MHASERRFLTAIEMLGLIAAGISFLLLVGEAAAPQALAYGWWHGFVWSAFFGLASGSYATSFTARLPRNISTLGGRDPYCASCDRPLRPRDLFTVFSYLSTGGVCRYCRAPIPRAVFVTECATVLVFLLAWCRFGSFDDRYLVTTLFGLCGVVLAAIYAAHRQWHEGMALAAGCLAAFYRIWSEASISAAVLAAATGLVIAGLGKRFSGAANLPAGGNAWKTLLEGPLASLSVFACLWLPLPGVAVFFALYAAGAALPEALRPGWRLAALFLLMLCAPLFQPLFLLSWLR